MRLNETGGELDFCSACKISYLKLTGEVVVKENQLVDIEILVKKSIQM